MVRGRSAGAIYCRRNLCTGVNVRKNREKKKLGKSIFHACICRIFMVYSEYQMNKEEAQVQTEYCLTKGKWV